jgi:hypothetical protein
VRPLLTLLACIVVAATGLLAGAARPAAAATPCWKTLLNDWYDGRIDHVYPVQCYRDALKHLPTDVSTYSSAHDDILRALQATIAADRKKGTKITATTPVPAGGGSTGGTTTTTSGGGPAATTTTAKPTSTKTKTTKTTKTTTTPTTTSLPGKTPGGGIAGGVQASNPSSVPVPLIVLGALAGLLIVGGGVGLAVRRRRPRGPAA